MTASNREDAFRAREVALKKLENKDFIGAQKIILKAQKLFPELDNVSQLLTICEVHCAAEARVNKLMDWYAILQVEAGADEAIIRKQYRRLAFSLHPDKNSFAGAEEAFKLVANAYSVLRDREKRSQYDIKRGNGSKNVANPREQSSNMTDVNKGSVPGCEETFWTICPHCQKRYQYYRYTLSRLVRCMQCTRNFVPLLVKEYHVPNGSPGATSTFTNQQSGTSSQQGHPIQRSAKSSSAGGKADGDPRINVAEGNGHSKGNSSTGQEKESNYFDKNAYGRLLPYPADRNIVDGKEKSNYFDKNAYGRSMPDPADRNNVDGKNFGTKVASTVSSAAGPSYLHTSGRRKQDTGGNIGLSSDNNKRQRKNVLSSDVDTGGNIGLSSDNNKRQRKNVLSSDVDMGCTRIFDDNVISDVQRSDLPHVGTEVDIQVKDKTTHRSDLDDINREAAGTIHEKKEKACYSEFDSLPDPDFFNFEKLRDVSEFSIGQIWALYDNLDRMPRYYAQIKHFDPSNFEVKLTWLLYNAMDEEHEKWNHEQLPVACGNFRLGKLRDTLRDRSSFSHIVACRKGKRRNTFVIYPKKGEVWALYKGWSMQWSSDPDSHRSYEYDVVEVLSSMLLKDGATVKPLVRIKGFVSLFAPAKDHSFVIPSSELLRFSHSIPLYRTKGGEKEGVPGGLLELDNACLPVDLDAAFSSVTLDTYMSLGKISSTFVNLQNCLSSAVYTYPDPDFHDFEEGRSIDKFEHGQLWALYCDLDTFPKLYGWISKVERDPFMVHLIWLEACSGLEQEKQWLKQDVPVSCGTFKVESYRTMFETNHNFSHRLDAEPTGSKWHFKVLPRVGEIWAIYMNWAPDWAPTTTDACDFAVGEIVEHTEDVTKVTFLSQVTGYTSVFRPDRQKGVMEIPTQERLRFSHQIPFFRLTEEGGGKLRGFYELDPACVPDVFLYGDDQMTTCKC